MNVCKTEAQTPISARTCGCKAKGGRIVAYTLIDSYHGLCVDKRDIILSELEACLTLLKYSTDDTDRSVIEKEIEQLNILLGLLS
jgi:hypothetical protein